MSFDKVRQLGTSILASAGIASIIVGLAARQSIATLLAGVQIAITQPIRYDDVVIVEGEWGRIEEITLTYVVIRIWDLRRLIIPISYFLEKPFQNWTRTSANLLERFFSTWITPLAFRRYARNLNGFSRVPTCGTARGRVTGHQLNRSGGGNPCPHERGRLLPGLGTALHGQGKAH